MDQSGKAEAMEEEEQEEEEEEEERRNDRRRLELTSSSMKELRSTVQVVLTNKEMLNRLRSEVIVRRSDSTAPPFF